MNRDLYLGVACFLAALLTGCVWLESVTTRTSPDTRTQLAPGQHMEFSRIMQRNAQGRHMDEFKCPERHVMVCEAPAASWDCSCRSAMPGVMVQQ